MKLKRPVLFGLEVAAGLIFAAAGAWVANRFSRKENRQAQALERIAAVVERAYPVKTLPRPSLYRADLKPIPAPDPEPCGETMDACAEPSARAADDKAFERDLERTEKSAWDRMIRRLPGHSVEANKTVSSDGCNTTTCGPKNADGSQVCATTALYCGASLPTIGGTAVER